MPGGQGNRGMVITNASWSQPRFRAGGCKLHVLTRCLVSLSLAKG